MYEMGMQPQRAETTLEEKLTAVEKKELNKEPEPSETVNQVYVFAQGIDEGFMFYDQSPYGAVAKFAGYLPEGKFWSSGEFTAKWDDKINGPRAENYFVDDDYSIISDYRTIKTPKRKTNVTTIIVSEENFKNLISQIRNPQYDSYSGFRILNINSKFHRELNDDYNQSGPKF